MSDEDYDESDPHDTDVEFHGLTDAGIVAVITQLQDLGYDASMIDPTTLSEKGYNVVVSDGLGGILMCEDCETAIRIGPMPWLDEEHWLIVESWLLQDRDLREILQRAEEVDTMYTEYRTVLQKNFEEKVQPEAERKPVSPDDTPWLF